MTVGGYVFFLAVLAVLIVAVVAGYNRLVGLRQLAHMEPPRVAHVEPPGRDVAEFLGGSPCRTQSSPGVDIPVSERRGRWRDGGAT